MEVRPAPKKLRLKQIGLSLEDIEADEFGFCYFPDVGEVEVKAYQFAVREAREVEVVKLSPHVAVRETERAVGSIYGDNIIVDILRQSAYKERRSTLQNDNGVKAPDEPPAFETGVAYKGKFFSRGARGKIEKVLVYCKRTATGTITLKISPHPNLGEILSVTVTPSSEWDWAEAEVNAFWDYDSLFIWTSAVSSDVSIGHDSVSEDKNPDSHISTDNGATWTKENYRRFIRIELSCETPGDLPISGTVNNVEIPNRVAGAHVDGFTIPSGSETEVLSVDGAGIVLRIAVFTSHSSVEIRFAVDGVLIPVMALIGVEPLEPAHLNTYGFTANTPQIQLLYYTAGGSCVFAVTIPFQFKRKFEVYAYQTTGADQSVSVGVTYNKIA